MISLKTNNYLRISKEINNHYKSKYYNKIFDLEIDDDDLSELTVTLKGCENSIYENQLIKLKLLFLDYPWHPFLIKFISKIWHPHIS